MPNVNLFIVAVLGLSLATGCEREDAAKSTPATAPAAADRASATATAPATMPDAAATADEARRRAAAAETTVRDAAAGAVQSATDANNNAQTQATAAAQMTSDEAKKMLDQAMSYIKENKYDLAEKTLAQVEANKAMLPKTLQDQLGAVRTALTTAKAGGGLQLPGFGAGAK